MTKDFAANPEMEALFYAEESSNKGRIPVVIAVSGHFRSVFQGVPKPSRPGSPESLPELIGEAKEAKESRILVIGDEDFASTMVQYSRSDRNLNFLVSAADWLSNDLDLLAIRSRSTQDTRLNLIEEPAERARVAFASQFLNVVVIPATIIAHTFFRILRRKSRTHGSKEGSDVL